MASTTFVNNVTLTDAAWFNDVNTLVYILAGDGTNAPTTDQLVRTNLSINNLTEDTAPDPAADYIETYDASAGTAKKVLVSRIGGITLVAPVVSTSGTSIDFSAIPAGVRRVTCMWNNVSLSGTANLRIQIGPIAGVETSVYNGNSVSLISATVGTVANGTSGFDMLFGSAASTFAGRMILNLEDSTNNVWISDHLAAFSTTNILLGSGRKAIAGALSIVRFTTSNGTDTFDAGSVSISYE